ncbi:hypothetical protein IDJ77_07385 [Mucilaginibacter sp. ZT4R22]|uniref:Uncharacterized protein n=1 Tax=Mucilaginibacter pankratovii TaxID=2772110 RepID=A0ABR7WMR7_9SPHI|nr:hypothetical protein [Mucilaginibacter pankratovii]MBD1363628.1 hypothetical protein [Mucilaginibacter pankratovii]
MTDKEPSKAFKNKIKSFVNTLSADELEAFEKNIEKGCEQIDEADFFIMPFDE